MHLPVQGSCELLFRWCQAVAMFVLLGVPARAHGKGVVNRTTVIEAAKLPHGHARKSHVLVVARVRVRYARPVFCTRWFVKLVHSWLGRPLAVQQEEDR